MEEALRSIIGMEMLQITITPISGYTALHVRLFDTVGYLE
jgi:hypothetical protein